MTGTETPTQLHKVKPLKLSYFWDIKHNDTLRKTHYRNNQFRQKKMAPEKTRTLYIYIYIIYIYILYIYIYIIDIYLDVIIVVTQ